MPRLWVPRTDGWAERAWPHGELTRASLAWPVAEIGSIAHDLNNLITTILGSADLALMTVSEPHPSRQWIGEIKKSGARAAGITRQLLAFSRRQILAPSVVDLNSIAREIEGLLQLTLGRNRTLTLSLAPALRPVKADPAQIEQILMNWSPTPAMRWTTAGAWGSKRPTRTWTKPTHARGSK